MTPIQRPDFLSHGCSLCRYWHRCRQIALVLLIGLALIVLPVVPAFAATESGVNLVSQAPIEVKISLGTAQNELKFVPDRLTFEAGKRYKLILVNPSSQKHYFTAKDFADVSWTQNVKSGKLEVKGAVHEIELKPEGKAQWSLIPIKPGTYELHCSIPGHAEAGMRGAIAISAP